MIETIAIKRAKLKEAWMVIYMFIAVFEPPFLPVAFIYVMLPATFILLVARYDSALRLDVVKQSQMYNMFKLFLGMSIYLLIVNIINLSIEPADLFINRMRCFNQLCVLTITEFLNIWYLLVCMRDEKYGFEDAMRVLIKAAVLQGICSVLAYTIPQIRELFTVFADEDLFSSAYFVARRGYGFSQVIVDTFGYGMGLVAGYVILHKHNIKTGRILWKILALLLVVFSITVNARTGFVVIAVAIALKILQRILQCKNKMQTVIRCIIAISILYVLLMIVVPELLKLGLMSENLTIQWVTSGFNDLYQLVFGSEGLSASGLQEASFLSNWIDLPENAFELFFGSGHSVYGTRSILGFATDIGYINLIWELGIIGTTILLGGMLVFMFRPFLMTNNVYYRSIVLLNVISYFAVLFKAVLIGYNPGIFINYFCTFALYFFIREKKE